MNKWSDDKLKSRYEQVNAKHPNGIYAAILKAELAKRGIA